MLSKQILQFSEIENNPMVPFTTQQFAREFGFRSAIFAPMIRDNRVIGAIGVANFKPKVFSDKQVALIKAFADQAVIAIENTRLLNELALEGKVIHIPDVLADPEYVFPEGQQLGGFRSNLGVPLLRDGVPIGAFVLTRPVVKPFTDKQIELAETFADQAVIAIENVRLLNELRESLQQQTATADVLKVISSSPGELEPVFEAMLANATQLCNAKFGTLNLYDGDAFRIMAVHNVPLAFAETRLHELIRPHPRGGHAQMVRTKEVVHIEDIRKGQAYLEGDPAVVAVSDVGGARTIVLVPMLKDDKLVGTINIYRQEVLPFTDKQIELLTNFAAQAVIAIENTRLLNELRESLQQ
jgi:GAF domain-containing protein